MSGNKKQLKMWRSSFLIIREMLIKIRLWYNFFSPTPHYQKNKSLTTYSNDKDVRKLILWHTVDGNANQYNSYESNLTISNKNTYVFTL